MWTGTTLGTRVTTITTITTVHCPTWSGAVVGHRTDRRTSWLLFGVNSVVSWTLTTTTTTTTNTITITITIKNGEREEKDEKEEKESFLP